MQQQRLFTQSCCWHRIVLLESPLLLVFSLALSLNHLADESEEQTQWMQDTFGAEFVQESQADQATFSDEESDDMESLAVSFPSQHLPKVSQVELIDGTTLQSGDSGYSEQPLFHHQSA